MNNKVIIFGAGASYDVSKGEIPLTKGLFHIPDRNTKRWRVRPLTVGYRAISSLLGRIEPDDSFEDNLTKLSQKKEFEYSVKVMHYYLQELFAELSKHHDSIYSSAGSYTDFFQILREQKDLVTIITFNYDTLIEFSIEGLSHDRRFFNLPDYINGDNFNLVKLHGSWHWFRELNNYIESTPNNDFEEIVAQICGLKSFRFGEFKKFAVPLQTNVRQSLTKNSKKWFPAISAPLTGKDYTCPDDHVEFAINSLAMADELIVIGYRARDVGFRELLKIAMSKRNKGPFLKISVINKSETGIEDVEKVLSGTIGTANINKIATSKVGFGQYVQSLKSKIG